MRTAFFDLDRTLIGFNSAMAYAKWEHRNGRIGTLKLVQSAAWMGLYHLSLINMNRAYQRAVASYRGVSADELDQRTQEFFADQVTDSLLPAAAIALSKHREAGDRLVLLSSTSSYLAAAATERWNLDAWLANRFPTDTDGKLTGKVELPLCYGAGKVDHARRYLDAHGGGTLAQAAFYSDSYSDVAMLAAVGEPYVVNPDPRLRRLAKRRGWPISDWV